VVSASTVADFTGPPRHFAFVAGEAPSGTLQILPFPAHGADHRLAECRHDGAVRHVLERRLADIGQLQPLTQKYLS
jgi:hypothetical protein